MSFRIRKIAASTFISAAFLLAGCSGGNSGSATPTPPAIRNLQYAPAQVAANVPTDIAWQFDFTDTTRDISTGTYTIYNPSGAEVFAKTINLTISGVQAGTEHGTTYGVRFLTPGTYTATMFVTDASGLQSNVLTAAFTVNQQVPNFAYVANSSSNSISQYTIGVDGSLTAMTPATVPGGTTPVAIASDPAGRWLYVTNYSSSDTISQYTIGSNGALTAMAQPTVAAGGYPYGIVVHPSGKFVYAANGVGGSVSQYTIGATGGLSPMSPATVAAGTSPSTLVIDSTGHYLYVANFASNDISQYSIASDGHLTPLSPQTVAAGSNPSSITTPLSGKYVYVTNWNSGIWNSGTVSQYEIGPSGGLVAMTPATVPAGSDPTGINVDPQGKYAYVRSQTGSISLYSIGETGGLSAMDPATVPGTSGAWMGAMDPSMKYFYLTGYLDNEVFQYAVGPDGKLTALSTAPVATGVGPLSITIVSR